MPRGWGAAWPLDDRMAYAVMPVPLNKIAGRVRAFYHFLRRPTASWEDHERAAIRREVLEEVAVNVSSQINSMKAAYEAQIEFHRGSRMGCERVLWAATQRYGKLVIPELAMKVYRPGASRVIVERDDRTGDLHVTGTRADFVENRIIRPN